MSSVRTTLTLEELEVRHATVQKQRKAAKTDKERTVLQEEENLLWEKIHALKHPQAKRYANEEEARKDFNVNIRRIMGGFM
jgi:hypothetical protein